MIVTVEKDCLCCSKGNTQCVSCEVNYNNCVIKEPSSTETGVLSQPLAPHPARPDVMPRTHVKAFACDSFPVVVWFYSNSGLIRLRQIYWNQIIVPLCRIFLFNLWLALVSLTKAWLQRSIDTSKKWICRHDLPSLGRACWADWAALRRTENVSTSPFPACISLRSPLPTDWTPLLFCLQKIDRDI